MPRKTIRILSAVQITVRPVVLENPLAPEIEPQTYQVFRLDMAVDGKPLLDAEDKLTALDGAELWLSQRFNRKAWPLTCTCGVPDCAGFREPVTTTRKGGVLSWALPQHYFPYLKARGLVSGRPRPICFHFNAAQFYQEFDKALKAVRTYEEESGNPSSFEAGSYAPADVRLNEQLVRELVWHLKKTKSRRFAKHWGTPPGECAGMLSKAPLAEESLPLPNALQEDNRLFRI